MTERTVEASPRFKARMAGSFYVLAVLTAVFGEFFIRGRSGIAGGSHRGSVLCRGDAAPQWHL